MQWGSSLGDGEGLIACAPVVRGKHRFSTTARGSDRWRLCQSEIPIVSNENCHDKLFKTALADPKDAAMELRAVLPDALVSQIDFASLRCVPGSFVDEALRGSQADLLYTVKCTARPTLLYVLMEHKSEVDKYTLLQLLRYMVRIWDRCLAQKDPPRTLPPIIPVIVHHSEAGWTAPTHFHGRSIPPQCWTPTFVD
jgi:hypothetical protein